MVGTSRTMSTPGVSVGTMIIDVPWYGCTSGLVIAINTRKSADEPLDVNHLWPLITHSSPSRTALVLSRVGSEPAVSGSVIENALRSLPSRRGHSQRSFWSSVAPMAMSSALPESGAWLPKMLGEKIDDPR